MLFFGQFDQGCSICQSNPFPFLFLPMYYHYYSYFWNLDRSGTIDAREITSIQFGGKNVTINTASVLLKSFDNDRSGNITFWEYVALHKFIMHVQQAFMATDRDKSYTIDFNEIQSALHMVGFPNLNPALIQTLMAKFSMGNGHMTFEG